MLPPLLLEPLVVDVQFVWAGTHRVNLAQVIQLLVYRILLFSSVVRLLVCLRNFHILCIRLVGRVLSGATSFCEGINLLDPLVFFPEEVSRLNLE